MILSNLSLKYRIALVIFALEALMLTMVLWVSFSDSQVVAREQHAATTEIIMGMLGELAGTALLTEEYADIQFYFDQVQKDPTVVRVLMADITNKVVAASDINEIGEQLPVLKGSDTSFWVSRGIEYPAGQLGTLAIEFSTRSLKASYQHALVKAVSIAVIGISIILVVGIIVGFALTRRLETLTFAAKKFADGDTEAKTNIKGNDEIGRLGQTFDYMVDEVTKNQQQIKEQNDRIHLLMDSTAEGIFGLDNSGICTFINKAALEILGYSAADSVIGQPLHNLIRHYHADGKSYLVEECHMLECLNKGELAHSEDEVFWKKDGTSIPVEYWAHPIVVYGRQEGSVVAFVDVTQRKKAQAEMRRLNAELEALLQERTSKLQEQATILDQIHDSVVITDMQGHITGWNRGAENLYGYTASEVIGRYVALDSDQDQVRFFEEKLIKPLKEKGEHESEMIMRKKDGTQLDVHLSLSLLKDAQGLPVNMVAYAIDITDRKRAEREQEEAMRQAKEANRAKSEFLSRMSHELRTPMNAILGFGQLLESDPDSPLPDEQRECVKEILHAGNHLLELINEVLDLSRIEAGKLSVSSDLVSLRPLLKECYTMVRPMAEEYGVHLQEIGGGCAISVKADRTRLKQVLLNLLTNAIKYNRKDGDVEVSCAVSHKSVRIDVRDGGAGLTPGQIAALFVPFERLDADKTAIEGTGIGLALSKRLMEMMGGEIGVESSPGIGSTFWISLTVGDTAEDVLDLSEANLEEESTIVSDEVFNKILCIEDNPANMRLIEAILSRRNIQVLTASVPGLGLELARTHLPALILLDINLPDMDGYDVMRCLKENEATRYIPVVAISANAMPEDLARGKAAGFFDYLVKPLDMNQMLAVVDSVLADKRAEPK